MKTVYLYPLRLEASLHETIWGGRLLEQERWKELPPEAVAIGEAWETEVSTIVQNGPFQGQALGAVVQEMGTALIGEQAASIFGPRFPLLAKFIDAHLQLSVQVHPNDAYAQAHEGGKLGKTEFWYILKAEPGASIVHGFQTETTREAVGEAIRQNTLERLLHEEEVHAGDVIFVPAGTVHAIGSGILLYELQEYSDVTYRMYDYGRLTAAGTPRELHIDRSLDVAKYTVSPQIKMRPVVVESTEQYEDRCLVACPYFVTREITLKGQHAGSGTLRGESGASCVILSSLGAEARIRYGEGSAQSETLKRGETIVVPAALGSYRIEGSGRLLFSYVPTPTDRAWQLWALENSASNIQ